MKKLDSKFLVTCAVLISLPLLFIILMALLRGCNIKKSYSRYEEMMMRDMDEESNNDTTISFYILND